MGSKIGILNSGCFMTFCIMLMAFLTTDAYLAKVALASGGGSADLGKITQVICQAVDALTGTIGKSISVLVVISMALMLFLGKVSWGLAIMVAVGMGILFGARDVVGWLSDGPQACAP